MSNNHILDYLVDSIRQQDGYFQNIINANHPLPCGICQKNVANNQKYLDCASCKNRIHIKCNGAPTVEEYNLMNEDDKDKWYCNKCLIMKMAAIFPFGLENNLELINIINCDSMKSLEHLPSYEITSKASSFDSLKQSDLDENIIANIESRYFPAHEFKNLNKKDNFNIFHTNLNGLENKFELLHNFISSTKLELDIINISETSQSEDKMFDMNVNIEGFMQPFTTGSKSARGGVAIFAKDDLKVFERDDLNIMDNDFEAVWIEIGIEKSKNLICGCFYRHPNSDINDFINYISKTLVKISKEKKECYLSGDFNIDLLKYDSNPKHRDFLNTMTSFGFLPHILQPTRITDSTSTIIDNIYSNNFEQESFGGNILIQFSDHLSQFLSIEKKIKRVKPADIHKRDLSNFDEQSFINDISIQNWNVHNLEGTNNKFNDFFMEN